MSPPGWIRWLGFALLGIVVAAAVSIAASRLSSQQIGLASEPISAGEQLVPKAASPISRTAATAISPTSPDSCPGAADPRRAGCTADDLDSVNPGASTCLLGPGARPAGQLLAPELGR